MFYPMSWTRKRLQVSNYKNDKELLHETCPPTVWVNEVSRGSEPRDVGIRSLSGGEGVFCFTWVMWMRPRLQVSNYKNNKELLYETCHSQRG